MENRITDKKSIFGSLKTAKRQAIDSSAEGLVEYETFSAEKMPLVVRPKIAGLNFVEWGRQNREEIREKLEKSGAVLFRDFPIESVEVFQKLITETCGEPLEYRERTSPRSRVGENIYTSTDHPPDQCIFLHNEQSYNRVFPLRIAFYCVTEAAAGGATPIADTRKIFGRLSDALRQKFAEKQYLYVRNFGEKIGLSWQAAFQTNDKSVVEKYCRENDIEFEWSGENHLRTRQKRPAIFRHPRTNEEIWFNHATFFHVSTLPPEIGEMLLKQFGKINLPNNTYYGDGSRIESDTLDELRAAYIAESVEFKWRKGDVLLLDNMLTAHGRTPFSGNRKIVVAMAEAFDSRQSEIAVGEI